MANRNNHKFQLKLILNNHIYNEIAIVKNNSKARSSDAGLRVALVHFGATTTCCMTAHALVVQLYTIFNIHIPLCTRSLLPQSFLVSVIRSVTATRFMVEYENYKLLHFHLSEATALESGCLRR